MPNARMETTPIAATGKLWFYDKYFFTLDYRRIILSGRVPSLRGRL